MINSKAYCCRQKEHVVPVSFTSFSLVISLKIALCDFCYGNGGACRWSDRFRPQSLLDIEQLHDPHRKSEYKDLQLVTRLPPKKT